MLAARTKPVPAPEHPQPHRDTAQARNTAYKKEISQKAQVAAGRYAVVAVALVATALAFSFNESVLNVVGYA